MHHLFARTLASTAFISMSVVMPALSVSAENLQKCVRAWQLEFPGISTDRAINECRIHGFPSDSKPEETKAKCIKSAIQVLTTAYNSPSRAAREGKEFCNNGGDSACLSQSVDTLSRAYNSPSRAAREGKEFCNNGGDSSCLAQSVDTFNRAYNSPSRAAREAKEICQNS